jgi:hypothetical protein
MTKGELMKALEKVDDNAEVFIVPSDTDLPIISLDCIDMNTSRNRVYLCPQPSLE